MIRLKSLCIAALLAGCASTPHETLTQISTINALLAGAYDGQMRCDELLKQGDFGIGTFDRLDGEMVVCDGTVYQVRSDGKVYTPSPETTTPFAAVTCFDPEQQITISSGADFDAVEKIVDQAAPQKNLFCAIRIDGSFRKMKTRSVPAQNKPYPPLVEVAKHQPVFEYENISGTIIGFRCPQYIEGLNIPGYHLHFLSADKTKGGHILAFEIANAEARIDIANRLTMILPRDTAALADVELGADRSHELEAVEK
ncbi:MAG: acetolactate decarboxylase [Pontiellaceae bacterium]|nr:acetolactate decarboxylase [Pontiellaceae bacterium]MBN2783341.1 acetolactate decarboxylase [Pontiellaceae bacterium]